MSRKVREDVVDRPPVRQLPAELPTPIQIDDVRKAVADLATKATRSVQAVRDAFAAGASPYLTAGSGSVSSYVSSFSSDEVGSGIVKSTAQLGLNTSTAGSSVAPPKPEIDSADVFEDVGGVLDQFSVRLVVSLPVGEVERAAYIKISRAKAGTAKAPRPAFSALSAAPSVSGLGVDRVSNAAFRAGEAGVGNKLTEFVSDGEGRVRSVTSPDAQGLRTPLPPQNTNRGALASTGLLELAGADRSVLDNLPFYLNRKAVGAVEKPTLEFTSVGGKVGPNVIRGSSVAASSDGIVQSSNAAEFVEIARIDPMRSSSRRVGDFIESSFVDRAVVYGSNFIYYVSCIGTDGTEGPRSRLVSVSIVRSVPPRPPQVSYSIIGGHPRFAIRCEKGADHVEIFRAGRSVLESVRLATDQSLITQGPATQVGQFWHLTDVGLGPDGSTTLVDVDAVAGDRLDYRIYSVDPYGLKCQTPFSCSLKMPDHGHSVPIPVPSITAEQAVGQPAVSVKMRVDDPRVAGFVLQRRDITIFERSVHQPNQPEWVDLGVSDPKRAGSRRGPTLLDADWPLFIPASSGSASFVDSTVRVDRKYQYAVGAIDRRGNRTLLVGSSPVGVYSKAIVDPPASFSATVPVDDGLPTGVLLTWTGGTQDFSPNALVGDQDVLAATAVRSVFQVERRKLGAPFWDALPSTTESYFFDRVSTDAPPAFRPPFVSPGDQYEYRVMAMQSGGFISPRTDLIQVSVVPPPVAPDIVWVRSTPIGVNPLSVVVSWDMASTFVERWEIERAVTNKVYGEQITSMDSRKATGLEYSRVANITPEASRARGLSVDGFELDRSVYIGNRFFVDSDVDRSNSYFYRVRTVGRLGSSSDWVYAGVILRDVQFDRKFYSTLTDDAKVSLASDRRPIKRTI